MATPGGKTEAEMEAYALSLFFGDKPVDENKLGKFFEKTAGAGGAPSGGRRESRDGRDRRKFSNVPPPGQYPPRRRRSRSRSPPRRPGRGYDGGRGYGGWGGDRRGRERSWDRDDLRVRRPLPPDWKCLPCGNLNFSRRMNCHRCKIPRQGNEDPTFVPEPMPDIEERGQKAFRGGVPPGEIPVAGERGNWLCTKCRNVNYHHRTKCHRCNCSKPVGAEAITPDQAEKEAPSGPPVAGVNNAWRCGKCQNVNFFYRETCNRCKSDKSIVEVPEPSFTVKKLDGTAVEDATDPISAASSHMQAGAYGGYTHPNNTPSAPPINPLTGLPDLHAQYRNVVPSTPTATVTTPDLHAQYRTAATPYRNTAATSLSALNLTPQQAQQYNQMTASQKEIYAEYLLKAQAVNLGPDMGGNVPTSTTGQYVDHNQYSDQHLQQLANEYLQQEQYAATPSYPADPAAEDAQYYADLFSGSKKQHDPDRDASAAPTSVTVALAQGRSTTSRGSAPKKTQLFVFHIPTEMSESNVWHLFQNSVTEAGGDPEEVQHVSVVRKSDGESKGFGFVHMRTRAGAQLAIDNLHKKKIGKKWLTVQFACEGKKLREKERGRSWR